MIRLLYYVSVSTLSVMIYMYIRQKKVGVEQLEEEGKFIVRKRHIFLALLLLVAASFISAYKANKIEFSVSGPSSGSSAVTTVNGRTQGKESKKVSGKGDAKYNIDGQHAELTNISFDVHDDLKIKAAMEEKDGLVYAVATARDDDTMYYGFADGNYKEDFELDKLDDQFNDILKDLTGNDALRVSEDGKDDDGEVYRWGAVGTDNMYLTLCAKPGTPKWFVAQIDLTALENSKYTEEEIIDKIRECHRQLGGKAFFSEELNETHETVLTPATQPETELEPETEEAVNTDPIINTEGPVVTEPQTEAAQNGSGRYSLNVGGVPVNNIAISDDWSPSVSEYLISITPEDTLAIQYADSYIDIGNENGLIRAKESIEDVYETEVNASELSYGSYTIPVFLWESDGMRYARVYEPVPGGSSYLEMDITDISGSRDMMDTINRYAINMYN